MADMVDMLKDTLLDFDDEVAKAARLKIAHARYSVEASNNGKWFVVEKHDGEFASRFEADLECHVRSCKREDVAAYKAFGELKEEFEKNYERLKGEMYHYKNAVRSVEYRLSKIESEKIESSLLCKNAFRRLFTNGYTIEKIAKASDGDLLMVPGVGRKAILAIRQYLKTLPKFAKATPKKRVANGKK
jgi:predicted Fe-Mo cluster-binding NifX family protein